MCLESAAISIVSRQMTAVGAKGRAEDTTSFGSLSSSKQLETLDSGCSWSISIFVKGISIRN